MSAVTQQTGPGSFGLRLMRLAGHVVSPPGRHAALAVLIYHRVLPRPDPLRPRAVHGDAFRLQMSALCRCFNVLPLGEAVERLRAGRLPARSAAVTFDDGYADNHDVALPILRDLGLPATFFIATGSIGAYMWNDAVGAAVHGAANETIDAHCVGLGRLRVSTNAERLAVIRQILAELKGWSRDARDEAVATLLAECGVEPPSGLMMGPDQIRAMRAAGMEIGAHTVQHPILAHTSRDEAEREIVGSRETLEHLLGDKVDLFAYPNGRPGLDYTAEHVNLVRRLGFRAAVATARGVNRHGSADPHQLRRITPWDRQPVRFAGRLLAHCLQAGESVMQVPASGSES